MIHEWKDRNGVTIMVGERVRWLVPYEADEKKGTVVVDGYSFGRIMPKDPGTTGNIAVQEETTQGFDRQTSMPASYVERALDQSVASPVVWKPPADLPLNMKGARAKAPAPEVPVCERPGKGPCGHAYCVSCHARHVDAFSDTLMAVVAKLHARGESALAHDLALGWQVVNNGDAR